MRACFCLFAVTCLVFAGFGFAHIGHVPPPDDPPAIGDVMNDVMKPGLLRKAMGGEATDEEKLQILDMFIALTEHEPPQGDAEAWKARTTQLMTDYAKLLVGREGAVDALQTSSNCKSCHDVFKP
ncbi:MAG: hypothetical protein ACR2NP_22870 [Pirellulaceae bacterium]